MRVPDGATLACPAVEAGASSIRRIAGVVVSLVAVAGCVIWASGQQAPHFPTSTGGWAQLAAALLVYAAATVVRGWRWHMILRHAHIRHRAVDAYGLTTVGYMGNTVLPARGGELLRIFLMSERSSARRREVLGTIIPERLLDAAALVVLFVVLTAAGTGDTPLGESPAYVAGGLLVAGTAGLIVYLRLRVAGRLQGFADRLRPVARASRTLLTGTGAMLAAVSIAVWVSEAVVFWLVAGSVDVSLSLLDALLVVVLASFLALVPSAPGYLGTYDAALLFGLDSLGVNGGTALSVALMFRFVVFVPITFAGLGLMVARYGGLRAARSSEATSGPRLGPLERLG
jgi:uncharacterized membrane protein YbhN (UPF0104 family)